MSKLQDFESPDPPSPRSDRVDAWDMDVHVGSVLGKYRLLAELGQGGMSNVFLSVARGPNGFNKLVVLKMLRPSLARDPQFLSMFLDEARLAARLNHPNVVQTNEVGIEDERHLIAMEYLEGQPLSRLIQRAQTTGTPISRAMHLRILADALNGLHYAHELTEFDGSPLHLVHRDVSPQNIFVTYDGQVKVLDFGIAKAVTSSVHTTHGVVKGKVAYMSPEQFAGDPLDRRADIFAMGVLIWECATGARMWKKKSDAVVLQAVLAGQIPSPRSVDPNIDERFDAICKRALALYPVDRYPTAFSLQHDLEQLIDTQPERVTHRDIGKFVSDLFKEERSAVRTIVEKQLMAAKRLPTGEYAALGYAATLASSQPQHGSGASGARSMPIEGTPSQFPAPPPFRSAMSSDLAEELRPPRFTGSHAGVASTIRPPHNGGAWRWAAAITIGALACALGGFYWAKNRPADAASSSAAAAPAPATTPRGEVIHTPEPVPVPPPLTRAEPKPEPSQAEPPVVAKPVVAPTPTPRRTSAPSWSPRAVPPQPAPTPLVQAPPSATPTTTSAPQPPHPGRKFRTDI